MREGSSFPSSSRFSMLAAREKSAVVTVLSRSLSKMRPDVYVPAIYRAFS